MSDKPWKPIQRSQGPAQYLGPEFKAGDLPALPDCPSPLRVLPPANVVIDWGAGWPDGVDRVFTVAGLTADEFTAMRAEFPDMPADEFIDELRKAGYAVEIIERPNHAN